jgi:hypothetical protein
MTAGALGARHLGQRRPNPATADVSGLEAAAMPGLWGRRRADDCPTPPPSSSSRSSRDEPCIPAFYNAQSDSANHAGRFAKLFFP